MNNYHRNLILSNIDNLVASTEYSIMTRECRIKEIITDVMADNIEHDGKNDNDKNELLFRKLTHRGPKAFSKLLEILKEQEYTEAYKALTSSTVPSATYNDEDVVMDKDAESIPYLSIHETRTTILNNNSKRNNYLERQFSKSPTNNNSKFNHYGSDDDVVDNTKNMTDNDGQFASKPKRLPLEPYDQTATFRISKISEVKKATSFATHPKLCVYPMKSSKRGVFFFVNIINFKNNKKRQGAEEDRENLVALFQEMRYKVFYYEDLTGIQFENLLHDLIHSDHLKNVDSFVMCVQTHGDLWDGRTMMEFSDGGIHGVENIIKKFSNTDCEALANKPKVFFFPFCRGSNSDTERRISRYKMPREIETDGNPGLPSFSDILICYGTVPGFATNRDIETGSWFVRELCKVFADNAFDTHLEDLMKLVSQRTFEIRDGGRLQVASYENRGFNKLLFFNPKIEDN